MNEEAVSKQLAIAFEYSYLHDDWVNPLEEAMSGIDAKTALKRLTMESKSIWEIVLHMAVWNENIVERVNLREPVRPSEGAWPTLPEGADEDSWEQAKARLRQSIGSLQYMLREESLEKLMDGPYSLADVLVRFIHNGYHIGQITILREIIGVQDH